MYGFLVKALSVIKWGCAEVNNVVKHEMVLGAVNSLISKILLSLL